VVDTGSVDRTRDIAVDFGATLARRPWDNDFAAARNAGLALATGEWILYVDADERFAVEGDLRAALDDPAALAGLVRFRASQGFTPYLEYRLFRNRPDVRFRGAMHETILPDLERVMAHEGLRAVPVPASIEHFGYEGDLTAKHHRNLPLLEQAVLDDPGRPYLWFHLGAVRLALGDAGAADDAWSRAVAIARSTSSISASEVLAYVELALLRMRREESAADLLHDLETYRPGQPLTTWVAANHAMFERRWSDAIAPLESLLATDPSDLPTDELGYNRSIFEAQAAHALGVCWFRLEAYDTAAAMFARAAAYDPENPEHGVKRQLAEARALR